MARLFRIRIYWRPALKFAALLIAAMTLAGAIAAPAAAGIYDTHLDFSDAGSNPHGVYTYGYQTTLGGALTAFTYGGAINGQPGAWTSPSVETYLGVYDTGGSTLLHPGPTGQYSILRFTVAVAGTYLINGAFGSEGGNTTDVHVLFDGSTVFSGLSDGSHLSTGFSFSQAFTAGQTIDFAVGNGGNGYQGDSTLLSATLAVPEPASWALMISGFAMIGAAARRRRSLALAA
jgi:hypothetical protein